jgi:hypothetical protein
MDLESAIASSGVAIAKKNSRRSLSLFAIGWFAFGGYLAAEFGIVFRAPLIVRGSMTVATSRIAVRLCVDGEVVATREGAATIRHPADMGLLLRMGFHVTL